MDYHAIRSENLNYVTEIQQMMHGFGDCAEPLIESARIIEDIVLHQMRSIVRKANEVAERRGNNIVDTQDFLFLLRKNKVKLQRLVKYLELKELKLSFNRITSSDDSEFSTDMQNIDELKRNKRPWQYFLEILDTTGELREKSSIDIVKHDRCVRAEIISKNLDEDRYIEYSKARNVSFVNKHRHKFSDWVIPNGDINVSKQGYFILSYLAYETVAQIVDLVFLVRQDQSKIHGDIIDRMRLGHCNFQTYKPYQNTKSAMTMMTMMKPITPSEINEALRRYWSPQLEFTGPFHHWNLRRPHLKLLSL